MIKVAISAGHGMSNATRGLYDNGIVVDRPLASTRHTEAHMNYIMALTGKEVLINLGIPVHLVRPTEDYAIHVSQRAANALKAGCTHYIDLHMNGGGIPLVTSGTETFYRTPQQKQLAALVQSAALSAFGLRNRGVKHESESPRGSLAVLDFPVAALLEMGFIQNLTDRSHVYDTKRRVRFWTIFGEKLLSYYSKGDD